MHMSPIHQAWPKAFCKAQSKGEEDKGDRRRGGKTTIRELTGLEFIKSHRAVENREKMEETGPEVLCGAPRTPAVKG